MPPLTLRTRFTVILVLGAVLPLGLVGYWLARGAERSGEELLLERLDETLREIADDAGARWDEHRSHLADIADHEALQAALVAPSGPAVSAPESLRSLYALYGYDFPRLSVLDSSGNERIRLEPAARGGMPGGPTVTVRLDVHARSGDRLGLIQAGLRFGSLLAEGIEWVGAPGSVLTVFDSETGFAVKPSSFGVDLLRSGRFEWQDEPWISRSLTIREPALEFALAAPVAPVTRPFASATRRGLLALSIVTALSLFLVTLGTARVTRSLSTLASAADGVARGDLDQEVPLEGGPEVRSVAAAFNTMTQNLRATLDELSRRESAAAVGEFAASLAHEVRNPLSSIRVDLQLADEHLETDRPRELVGRALKTLARLEDTVTGSLRVARSGHIDRADVDLRDVLEAAAHEAGPELAAHGAVLEHVPTSREVLPVRGDASALEQVFLNLILNAAQASAAGGVVRLASSRRGAEIEVSVADEGTGIDVEERARVFDPFYSTRDEGSGLGLSIVQRIVSAHGGSLTIESEVGVGTCATVRLRATPATRPDEARAAAQPE